MNDDVMNDEYDDDDDDDLDDDDDDDDDAWSFSQMRGRHKGCFWSKDVFIPSCSGHHTLHSFRLLGGLSLRDCSPSHPSKQVGDYRLVSWEICLVTS